MHTVIKWIKPIPVPQMRKLSFRRSFQLTRLGDRLRCSAGLDRRERREERGERKEERERERKRKEAGDKKGDLVSLSLHQPLEKGVAPSGFSLGAKNRKSCSV